MRLQDRVAVVTGAAGGIGEAVAKAFANEGASLIAADINLEGAVGTVEAISRCGGEAVSFELDITKRVDCQKVVDIAVKEFKRLDILVNAAGVGSFGHFNEITPEEFDRVMRINLNGTFYCAQAAAKIMSKQKYGRIINIASISGERAGEHRAAYGTSKAAVIGLTKQGARDLGEHGVTVNAIAPGPIDTPLTKQIHTEWTRKNYLKLIPVGRYGTVDEIADAAVFLGGETAGYVNGHILFVDGGYNSAGVAEASLI